MITELRAMPDRHWSIWALLLVLTVAMACGSAAVRADSRDQAKRIHDRIAGIPPSAADLATMQNIIDTDPTGDGPFNAALLATDNPAFYNVTLKNFVAPWTNRDQAVFVPLNDYTATVIGIVRDDIDFRRVERRHFYTVSGVNPPYSTTSNAHYEAPKRRG
jgi:hypothetical protein